MSLVLSFGFLPPFFDRNILLYMGLTLIATSIALAIRMLRDLHRERKLEKKRGTLESRGFRYLRFPDSIHQDTNADDNRAYAE